MMNINNDMMIAGGAAIGGAAICAGMIGSSTIKNRRRRDALNLYGDVLTSLEVARAEREATDAANKMAQIEIDEIRSDANDLIEKAETKASKLDAEARNLRESLSSALEENRALKNAAEAAIEAANKANAELAKIIDETRSLKKEMTAMLKDETDKLITAKDAAEKRVVELEANEVSTAKVKKEKTDKVDSEKKSKKQADKAETSETEVKKDKKDKSEKKAKKSDAETVKVEEEPKKKVEKADSKKKESKEKTEPKKSDVKKDETPVKEKAKKASAPAREGMGKPSKKVSGAFEKVRYQKIKLAKAKSAEELAAVAVKLGELSAEFSKDMELAGNDKLYDELSNAMSLVEKASKKYEKGNQA